MWVLFSPVSSCTGYSLGVAMGLVSRGNFLKPKYQLFSSLG